MKNMCPSYIYALYITHTPIDFIAVKPHKLCIEVTCMHLIDCGRQAGSPMQAVLVVPGVRDRTGRWILCDLVSALDL